MSDDQDHARSGGDAGAERALDELRDELRAIAASVAGRDLTADVEALRVDVAALVGRGTLHDLSDELASLRAELSDLRRQLGAGDGTVVEQLQDNLADVASGEVVGALWDEVRQLRTDLPDLVAVPGATPATSRDDDPQIATLIDELTVLRADLDEGLVVEPSDALTGSLDALRAEVDALRDALGDLRSNPAPVAAAPVDDGSQQRLLDELGALRGMLEELRGDPASQLATIRDLVASELDTVRQAIAARLDTAAEETAAAVASVVDRPAPAPAGVDPETLDLLLGEIRAAGTRAASAPAGDGRSEQLDAIVAGIDDLRARLDEGLVLADDAGLPSASAAPDGPGVEAIADQIAALRDFVASELDTVAQTVSARLDAAAEATASTVAAATSRPEPESIPVPEPATASTGLDADTVELLRDEIRAAGAIADQVIDGLREELKALRRRMAVKASERVLDDQQLAQIADAVAARLAQDGDQA